VKEYNVNKGSALGNYIQVDRQTDRETGRHKDNRILFKGHVEINELCS